MLSPAWLAALYHYVVSGNCRSLYPGTAQPAGVLSLPGRDRTSAYSESFCTGDLSMGNSRWREVFKEGLTFRYS